MKLMCPMRKMYVLYWTVLEAFPRGSAQALWRRRKENRICCAGL